MEKYQDRYHAGKVLAKALRAYQNQADVIVLGLPRGGVPVAYEVAKELQVPLDVFIVRKLGMPGNSELAMGAIAMGGAFVLNEDIIQEVAITQEEMDAVTYKEQRELLRREQVYRGDRPFPTLQNKTIILVDDGIATGASMRAAIKALREFHAKTIIVAVPVAAQKTAEEFAELADELICPLTPANFQAVGLWYENFAQTEDEEVHQLLKESVSSP